MSIRVFQINTVYGFGSTGRIVEGIKQVAEARGHFSYVAYGRGDSTAANTERFGSAADRYAHALWTRLTDRTAFFSSRNTRRIIQRINEWQPDVVHLHNLHGYYLNIELLLGFLARYGRPVVLTLHDCWTFTGHCPYFDAQQCDRWITGCQHCPEKSNYPASWLIDSSARNYRDKRRLFAALPDLTLVAPSQWMARQVSRSFVGGRRIVVIPNGIDLAAFRPTDSAFRQEYGLEGKTIVLGVAGRWTQRKGFRDYLELRNMLGESYVIVLVGVSSRQLQALPQHVIGIRRTASIDELAAIYTAADVFVNMTYEETFGMVNIEALACGTPVITYPSGGIAENLSETCGVVVAEKSSTAVVRALERLPQFTQAGCRERAEAFDRGKVLSEYVKLYEQFANK